jgi:hypothetical protein
MAEYQPSFETLVRLAVEKGVLLASVLARYQQEHHIDDAQLSHRLDCTLDSLIHLKLCEVPRPDHFQEDVQRIADHVQANAVVLAQVLCEPSSAQ